MSNAWSPDSPSSTETLGSTPSVSTSISLVPGLIAANVKNYSLTSYTVPLPESNVWVPGKHKRNFVLTSGLYPVVIAEKMNVSGEIPPDTGIRIFETPRDRFNLSGNLENIILTSVVNIFPVQETQRFNTSGALVSIQITSVVITLAPQEVQRFNSSGQLFSITTTQVVVILPQQEIQRFDMSGSLVSITLTTV